MLNPLIGRGPRLDIDTPKYLTSQVRLERSSENSVIRALDPERAGVRLHLDVHAPVALVGEADSRAVGEGGRGQVRARRNVHRDGQHTRKRVAKVLERQDRPPDGRPAG